MKCNFMFKFLVFQFIGILIFCCTMLLHNLSLKNNREQVFYRQIKESNELDRMRNEYISRFIEMGEL